MQTVLSFVGQDFCWHKMEGLLDSDHSACNIPSQHGSCAICYFDPCLCVAATYTHKFGKFVALHNVCCVIVYISRFSMQMRMNPVQILLVQAVFHRGRSQTATCKRAYNKNKTGLLHTEATVQTPSRASTRSPTVVLFQDLHFHGRAVLI